MIPGLNNRQAQAMMRKMGIKQEEIDATEVVIKTSDKEIIIQNPQVSKVNMMGQETFQVIGQAEERLISSEPEISHDDIETVMQQTGASEEKAKEALKGSQGDLAGAILSLKENR